MAINITRLRPLDGYLLLRRQESVHETAAGIAIPDTVPDKSDLGEIVAVGAGKVLGDGKVRPLEVKVGDRVLFDQYAGQVVKINGEELLVMREADVFAVL
ncbi:MAG: co-chaperone GroES [Gallionella sp.]